MKNTARFQELFVLLPIKQRMGVKEKALKEEEKGITYNLIITNTIEFLDLMMDAVDSFWNIQLYFEKKKSYSFRRSI